MVRPDRTESTGGDPLGGGLLVDRYGLVHRHPPPVVRGGLVSVQFGQGSPHPAVAFFVFEGTLIRVCQGKRCFGTASHKMRMCVP